MRQLASILICALVAATPIALASPAAASTVFSVNVTCVGGALTFTPNSLPAAAGDLVDVTNGTGGSINVAGTAINPNPQLINDGATERVTVATSPAFASVNSLVGPCAGQNRGLQFTGGGSSSGLTSTSIPAAIVQQFGKPTIGSCEAVAPESLNWSGVASGGWGESWAQWMNGGNGGAVCTRTLVYSTAQSRWIVG
jgi:plastocyanin